jgi:hypothetical protein
LQYNQPQLHELFLLQPKTSEHGNVNLDPVGQAQKMAGLINLPSVVSIQMNYRNVQHKKKIKVYRFLNEW